MTSPGDNAEIDALITTFFEAFDNRDGGTPKLDTLRALFIDGARIAKTCGTEPETVTVSAFITPRQKLLESGALTDFHEAQTWHRTSIVGDVAHRFAAYEKSWFQNGRRFTGRGIKSFQLVRCGAGWRITSLAWDDERDGVVVPETVAQLDAEKSANGSG